MRPASVVEHRALFVKGIHNVRMRDRTQPSEFGLIESAASNCPLYYVAPDMTELAAAAGSTLPVAQLGAQIMPSATGFIMFDGELGTLLDDDGTYSVAGAVWRHDNEEHVDVYPLIEMSGALMTTPQWLLWPIGSDNPAGYANEDGNLDAGTYEGEPIIRTVLAAWLLMQQSIAWTESTQPDRPTSRRLKRAGLPVSPVTIVRLRKLVRADEENEGGELVAWSHRWLVNGHWRQQWYPSAQEHRPVWISPYVKGPDNKPFLSKTRVMAWVR